MAEETSKSHRRVLKILEDIKLRKIQSARKGRKSVLCERRSVYNTILVGHQKSDVLGQRISLTCKTPKNKKILYLLYFLLFIDEKVILKNFD